MLVVDYDGNVLEGDGQPPSELPIHLEILRARPDVQSVLHSHMCIRPYIALPWRHPTGGIGRGGRNVATRQVG